METLQEPLDFILVLQMHKIVCTSITLPMELFWCIFAHFCASLLFYVLLFLENHSIALQQLFQWCSWYFPGGYFIKETFSQFLSHCWKLFWCFLGLTLGYAPIFFRALSHFNLWNFIQMFFVLPWQTMS